MLPLLNAAALFLALYDMYGREMVTLAWYALALAAIYLGLSSAFGPLVSIAQFTDFPASPLTSTYTQPCGLTHSSFVIVPFKVIGCVPSNSAANE